MLPEYEFQHHQQHQQHQLQSYDMRQQEAQHQQRYGHSNNNMPSFACADSRFLKHHNGFDRSQTHHHLQDGWNSPKKHQNGWSSASANYPHHVSVSGVGGGKRMPCAAPGFNGSQQYHEASMLNNGTGRAHEFEFYEEVHANTPARVKMQEIKFEQSSWDDHNNGFYNSCDDDFDDGKYWKHNNGGFQKSSSPAVWIAKGI